MLLFSAIFIFGLLWGSFLNVLIDRLPNNETIFGRSKCDHCHQALGFFDLWPIVSFCVLLGRCRYCKNPISRQHLIVELLTAFIFTLAAYHLATLGLLQPLLFLKYGILLSGLIIIGFQDYKYMVILDSVIYAVAVPVLLVNLFFRWSLFNLAIAALALIIFFGLQFIISKGRWLGSGDIWLGGLLGLSFGWPGAWEVTLWGYILGAVVSIGLLILKKKEMTSQMPLGTFLSMAGILYLLIR